MSHLYDRMVSQFLKICHVLKSTWQNLRLTKGFILHITDIKLMCWYYTPHKVLDQWWNCLLMELTLPTHYNEFKKKSVFFLLIWQPYSIVGFWFNVHLQWILLEIICRLQDCICGLKLRFKKCYQDYILFLVDGCHSRPVFHLMKMAKGRWFFDTLSMPVRIISFKELLWGPLFAVSAVIQSTDNVVH